MSDSTPGASPTDIDVANACPAPIFIIQDDTIRFVNRAFAALLGREPGDLIGRQAIDAIHPADRAHLLERGHAAPHARTGVVRTQFRLKRADDGDVWVYATTAPLVYGGRDAVIGTAIDVHERRRAQESVTKAQRLEAIGRLAGGIAHDFNNLLQVVLGHAERLTQGLPLDEPLRESAAQIRRSADRAATLTDRLLSLGQRQLLEMHPIDLGGVLTDMRNVLESRLGPSVRLTIRPAQHNAMVRADRSRMVHVLVHLVDNAREAMAGGGELVIALESVYVDDAMRADRPWLRNGPYMRLVVADSGPGMDPGTAAQVFEPFFTTKPRGTGAGLGLSTVYGLVKQSNGFVWIETSPGAGTRVVVLLPAEGPVGEVADSLASAPIDTETSPPEAPRVLLVEDEPSVRDVLSIALSRHGFTVTTAASAEEAMPVDPAAFEILLTDVSLPGLSGVQLARHVLSARPATPVLLMSGYAREEVLLNTPGGIDLPFIAKPFTTRAIVERLRRLLEDGTQAEVRPS
jgi:two-component system cell cycle sensor histidine kinase/response regulator CckA